MSALTAVSVANLEDLLISFFHYFDWSNVILLVIIIVESVVQLDITGVDKSNGKNDAQRYDSDNSCSAHVERLYGSEYF